LRRRAAIWRIRSRHGAALRRLAVSLLAEKGVAEDLSVLLVMIFLSSVAFMPVAAPGSLRRLDPHFFFLGAAFMLMEVRAISQLALLFGATWMVSSIVITAVLV